MLDNIFKGLFDTDMTAVISVKDFVLSIGVSLAIGLVIALCYMYRTRYTKSFVTTLAILPCVVCVVIMMVNGNIGAGVAVAGAFSLIRFRSVPGTAREIGMIFMAMGVGLISGMGYLAFAALFALVLCSAILLYARLDMGCAKNASVYKTLNITIPEDLDYSDVFDGLLSEYTKSFELIRVKTTDMGSLFRLTYNVKLRDPAREKEFIDKLRQRNGNLEISISKQDTTVAEL